MVAPGPLLPAHAELETDCFACHAPLRGAAPARCVACHALPDIGLRTTKGVPIAQAKVKASFHQKLIEQDCMACHSDHQGPQLVQVGGKGFSHALLQADVRETCETCHAAPANDLHRDLAVGCGQCHTGEAWQPATFEHARLAPAVREQLPVLPQGAGRHAAPPDQRQLRAMPHARSAGSRPPSTTASSSCWMATTTPPAPPAMSTTTSAATPATAAMNTNPRASARSIRKRASPTSRTASNATAAPTKETRTERYGR